MQAHLRANYLRRSWPLLLLLLPFCWLITGSAIPDEQLRSDWILNRPYVIDVRSESAEIDLLLNNESEYELILNCLGDAGETFDVFFESSVISKPKPQHQFRLLKPLPYTQHTSRNRVPVVSMTNHRVDKQEKQFLPSPDNHLFYLHVTNGPLDDAKQYVSVKANKVAEGQQCVLYLDQQQSLEELDSQLLEEIVFLLDKQVMPGIINRFGNYSDIDGNGKLTVLITPWLEKLQGGSTAVDGFVRGADFDLKLAAPFSNQCDVLYLNSRLKPNDHLKTLLAHELTHAVLFSSRLAVNKHRRYASYEEDWLNEALAHLGENLEGGGWSNLDYRVSCYLEDPQQYPLVVSDYYRSGMWRNHGCRGATYLFLRWCVDQFGEEILTQLIQAPVAGRRNIELATGKNFEELFRRWSIAVSSPSIYPASHPIRNNACCIDRYRSLDLWGELNNWNLAGVNKDVWSTADSRRRIQMRGTTLSVMTLRGSNSQGWHKINITAQPGANLQITLIKRKPPPQPASLSVQLFKTHQKNLTAAESVDVPPTDVHLKVTVNNASNNKNLQLEKLSVEQNGDKKKLSLCNKLASQGVHSHQILIPNTFYQSAKNEMLLKAVLRDQHRRRFVIRKRIILP